MKDVTLPEFIAVTGPEASGKDVYAGLLTKMGYLHIAAGDVIRERARSLGFTDPIPRSTLSQVGDAMKEEFGPSPITQSSLATYEAQRVQFPAGLVISGLRRVGELTAFKEHGAIALWIAASDDQRYANQQNRARGDQQSREEFLARSRAEYFGTTEGGTDGVNLQAIESLADCKITNDGSLDDLYIKGDEILAGFVTE